MRPWNNRERQKVEGSIQKRLKLQTAVAAAAVKAQPTLKMGLVDVCTILCGNSERSTGKLAAVAEEREGGNSERASGKPVAVKVDRQRLT